MTKPKKSSKKKISKRKNVPADSKHLFDLSNTVKPLADFQNVLDTTIVPLNDAKIIIDNSLKPLLNTGIKLDERFPNLINLSNTINAQLKPISDLKLTLDKTVKPIISMSNKIFKQLEPISKIQIDVIPNPEFFSENLLKLENNFQLINTENLKITKKLKPLIDFSENFPNFDPSTLIPSKHLVNFAQNIDTISSQLNKDLLGSQINYYAPIELEEVEKPKKKSKKKKIQNLIKKLQACKPGKKDWKKYEDICNEIFSYCFSPDLDEPLVQSFTEDKLHRRDLIFYIPHGLGGFWEFIILKFGLGIVIDCKNYSSEISDNEVRIATKYLGKKKLTTFGLIISRKTLSKSGKKYNEIYGLTMVT